MIIRGNTVGTPMPRSDYAQEDPKAADYIKNKPDAAIQRAQESADQALAAVDAARAEAKAYTDAAQAEAGAYTDTSVRKAAHVNLLDNSDFRNPVNQSGKTTYDSAGYTIDRWTINGNTNSLVLVDNGIEVTAKSTGDSYLIEYLESSQLFGKMLTFAVKPVGEPAIIVNAAYPSANPSTNTTIKSASSGNISIYMSAFVDKAGVQIKTTKGTAAVIEWAALYEGAYTAQTLPEYHPKGYMAEALNCGALHVTTTATITTTWSGSAAPYTQEVTVSGILASDMPHITPNYSTTNATAIDQKEAWACISKAVTAAGKITFTCFEDKPTTAIPIQIEVIR